MGYDPEAKFIGQAPVAQAITFQVGTLSGRHPETSTDAPPQEPPGSETAPPRKHGGERPPNLRV